MASVGALLTHPIQYYSPILRELAKIVELQVYYCFKPSKREQGKEFGIEFEWDVPLLEGYSFEFLKGKSVEEKIAKGNFDAFVLFGWHYETAKKAIAACKKNKVRVFARSDAQLPMRPALVRAMQLAYMPRFLSMLDGFLSVGQRFTEYLRFFGVPQEKIFPCPHCVDNEFFKENSAKSLKEVKELREKYELCEENTVFLFCGKIIARKRPLDFLKALKTLKEQGIDAAALVVGEGALKKDTMSYSQKHCLRVSFTGFLNQSQLPKAYSASDCLVLPSNGLETWGLVVNEAFACGTPAIVSEKCGCVPDLIEDGKTGYCHRFKDVKDISEKMKRFLSDKEHGIDFKGLVEKKISNFTPKQAADSIMAAIETKRD